MKTLFAGSVVCALVSILAELGLCMFGMDEAPTPWDRWTLIGLGLLVSVLVWSGVTVWSGLWLWRKKPHAVALWVRILAGMMAVGYVSVLLLAVLG